MTKAKRTIKRLKLQCKLCDRIVKSQNGMFYHIKNKHPEQPGCRKGVNWDYVRSGTETQKPRKVIAPDMQYIDVPATIRIPITMGPIQIVAIGE